MSWRRFFRRGRADAELIEEVESYMAEEIAENVARGMTPVEARRRARIKLGNSQRVRDELWQQNTVTMIDNLWRDLRYAIRTLRRTPGFATIAILVMALGIGANVALFTVVRSVLLNPLPFRLQTSSWRCMQSPTQARAVVLRREISMIGKAGPTASSRWPSGDGAAITWPAIAMSFRSFFRPSHAHGTCFQPWEYSPLWEDPSSLQMIRTKQLPLSFCRGASSNAGSTPIPRSLGRSSDSMPSRIRLWACFRRLLLIQNRRSSCGFLITKEFLRLSCIAITAIRVT